MAAVHFTRYACSSYSPSLTEPGRGGDGPAPKILYGFELDHTRAWSKCRWLVEAQAPQLYQIWTLFVFFAES